MFTLHSLIIIALLLFNIFDESSSENNFQLNSNSDNYSTQVLDAAAADDAVLDDSSDFQ